jgi:hypothetical protein
VEKKKWGSPQAIVVMALILLIFTYIGYDIFHTKPIIKAELDAVKIQYEELSDYLDNKIPEFDSTLQVQANQINRQGEAINILNNRVSDLAKGDEGDTESPTPPSFE